jgi:hypothetical protein
MKHDLTSRLCSADSQRRPLVAGRTSVYVTRKAFLLTQFEEAMAAVVVASGEAPAVDAGDVENEK